MKTTLMLIALFCCCGGDDRPPPVKVVLPKPDASQDDTPFCGDGVCDDQRGESPYNCIDCGYDPLIGGPKNGGTCGDGVCFGKETILSCWIDCRPIPINPDPNPDPGPFRSLPKQR